MKLDFSRADRDELLAGLPEDTCQRYVSIQEVTPDDYKARLEASLKVIETSTAALAAYDELHKAHPFRPEPVPTPKLWWEDDKHQLHN